MQEKSPAIGPSNNLHPATMTPKSHFQAGSIQEQNQGNSVWASGRLGRPDCYAYGNRMEYQITGEALSSDMKIQHGIDKRDLGSHPSSQEPTRLALPLHIRKERIHYVLAGSDNFNVMKMVCHSRCSQQYLSR